MQDVEIALNNEINAKCLQTTLVKTYVRCVRKRRKELKTKIVLNWSVG